MKLTVCILSFLLINIFALNHWPGTRFEISESSEHDCYEIGKPPVGDAAECKQAASDLGVDWNGERAWPHAPRGCFAAKNAFNVALWNVHPTGARNNDDFPICKKMVN